MALLAPALKGGGAERMMVHLARGFAENGFRTDLVLHRAEGPYLKHVAPDVRLIDLRADGHATAVTALAEYIRQEQPVALLSGLVATSSSAIAARRLAGADTRLVVREATVAQTRRLEKIRRQYGEADAVVATSHAVADLLVETASLPRERIEVIYNPTIPPDLACRLEDPPAHPWFGVGKPPVVLGVGSLRAPKNFADLIHAMVRVRRERRARLVILGEGKERAKLALLALELGLGGEVSLRGFVDNPYAYMARAEVLVLPSLWEGCPNVLVEAMACGTPVVATACPGGSAEILGHGKYGHLVPVGDRLALADAIIDVLDGNGREVQASWLRQFTIPYAARRYLEVLGLTPRRRMLFISDSIRGGVAISTLTRMQAFRELGVECEKLLLNPPPAGQHTFSGFTTWVARKAEDVVSLVQSRPYAVVSVINSPKTLGDLLSSGYRGNLLYEVRGRSGPALRACSELPLSQLQAVIVPSAYVAGLVKKAMSKGQGFCPVRVVPHAVDTRLFTPVRHAQSPVKGLPPVRPDTPVVLWVGRLGTAKNWLELLEVARILVLGGIRVTFWVLVNLDASPEGTGQAFETAVRQMGLEQHLHLIPYVPNARMPAVYDTARRSGGLVLSTSTNEGLQRSLLEGMACGCAVVSSAVGGNVELIGDGHNGRLYPPGQPRLAADAVMALLADHGRRQALASAGLELVRRRYTPRQHAKSFLAAANGVHPDGDGLPPSTAWYDAGYAMAWQDGERVPVWPDLSGNGHHAEQPDPRLQPVLSRSGPNGRPVLRFRSDYLRGQLVPGRRMWMVFAVWRLAEGSEHRYGKIFDGLRVDCGLEWKSTPPAGVRLTGPRGAAYNRPPVTELVVNTCVIGPETRLYENGRSRVVAAVHTPGLDGLTIGAGWTGARKFTGDLAEVIVYDRHLQEAERVAVERYLGDKYGIARA
ncbi:MAG: glycosyltransferase [bacterium]|nr:glycosyltransferase [bacterium]